MYEMGEESIDDWARSPTSKMTIPKSEWRQKQHTGNHNQRPGLDDVRKIKRFIKRGHFDHDIMDAFDISERTLLMIKCNAYQPVGSLLDY
jgi:hypothetical protein